MNCYTISQNLFVPVIGIAFLIQVCEASRKVMRHVNQSQSIICALYVVRRKFRARFSGGETRGACMCRELKGKSRRGGKRRRRRRNRREEEEDD